MNDIDQILIRHRRMAHAAWVRAVQQGEDIAAAERAWMVARAYCGLPT